MTLEGSMLAHCTNAKATVTFPEITPMRFPLPAPPLDHDGPIQLKPLHIRSTCCGQECPE